MVTKCHGITKLLSIGCKVTTLYYLVEPFAVLNLAIILKENNLKFKVFTLVSENIALYNVHKGRHFEAPM